jgi:hypothetical protein
MNVFERRTIIITNLNRSDLTIFYINAGPQKYFVARHDPISDHRIALDHQKEIAWLMRKQSLLIEHDLALTKMFPQRTSGNAPKNWKTSERKGSFSAWSQGHRAPFAAFASTGNLNEAISCHDFQRWHYARYAS